MTQTTRNMFSHTHTGEMRSRPQHPSTHPKQQQTQISLNSTYNELIVDNSKHAVKRAHVNSVSLKHLDIRRERPRNRAERAFTGLPRLSVCVCDVVIVFRTLTAPSRCFYSICDANKAELCLLAAHIRTHQPADVTLTRSRDLRRSAHVPSALLVSYQLIGFAKQL